MPSSTVANVVRRYFTAPTHPATKGVTPPPLLPLVVITVERWNERLKIRQDMLGCIDYLVLMPRLTLGVQAFAIADVGARARKLREPKQLKRIHQWLDFGGAMPSRAFSLVAVGREKTERQGQTRLLVYELILNKFDANQALDEIGDHPERFTFRASRTELGISRSPGISKRNQRKKPRAAT